MTLTRPIAPALYSQDGQGYDALVWERYYLAGHPAVWFVTEYDPKHDEVFGWAEIIPGFGELGYTNLAELEIVDHPTYGRVLHDTEWKVVPLRDAIAARAEALGSEQSA